MCVCVIYSSYISCFYGNGPIYWFTTINGIAGLCAIPGVELLGRDVATAGGCGSSARAADDDAPACFDPLRLTVGPRYSVCMFVVKHVYVCGKACVCLWESVWQTGCICTPCTICSVHVKCLCLCTIVAAMSSACVCVSLWVYL